MNISNFLPHTIFINESKLITTLYLFILIHFVENFLGAFELRGLDGS